MTYYNLTNATTSSTLVGMTQEINRLSGDILGIFVLIAFAVILFVAFKNFSVRTTMPIVAFLTTLIGIFMAILQIIPDFVMYTLIFITGGLVLASIFINPES